MLLMMKPEVIHAVSKQISYGLHDLLKTNAANIHSTHDWFTLFTLLEVVGAGTNPPPMMQVRPGVNVPEVINDAGRSACGFGFLSFFSRLVCILYNILNKFLGRNGRLCGKDEWNTGTSTLIIEAIVNIDHQRVQYVTNQYRL